MLNGNMITMLVKLVFKDQSYSTVFPWDNEFITCSMAIHPNKMVVATGQVAGTDRRDAMVSISYLEKFRVEGRKSGQ